MLDYIRIGCAVPEVTVADPEKNARDICAYIAQADEAKCDILVFPELAMTGFTCGDLFHQQLLLQGAKRGFAQVAFCTGQYPAVMVVLGIPVLLDGLLFNCGAVLRGGKVLGLVSKTFLPDHAEGEERRWFAPAAALQHTDINACELGLEGDYCVPVGTGQTFPVGTDATLGVEICEDLFAPVAPSLALALGGADVIVNLAASSQIAGKQAFRRELVRKQSENCRCIYAFCSAGYTESTRDLVYSGHSVIAQQGEILKENKNLVDAGYLLIADADLGAVRTQRCQDTSFRDAALIQGRYAAVRRSDNETEQLRGDGTLFPVKANPFYESSEVCAEVFAIQATGLAQRLRLLNDKAVIGVSGGLDSTLALLVAVEAMHRLNRPVTDVIAITMPGFGTTGRTYENANKLMKLLGVTVVEIPIRDAVRRHFADIGHDENIHDLTYENAQARERTQILMDYAGKVGGIVVGTGDLSELALGWCTYNGDHMSMYSVNASLPKTLIPEVIRAAAKLSRYACAEAVLQDVIDTPISPELLPPNEKGEIVQQTEDVVGPYALHDFFLYHTLKNGHGPEKIYTMACRAFAGDFDAEAVKKWLRVFYRRFFTQQFKRNCMPEGVKTLEVSLSPRADWRMPSDASAALWLREVDKL